jgi:putative copper export protein
VFLFAGVCLSRFLSWVEQSEIARQKAEAEGRKAAPRAAAPAVIARELEAEPDGVPAHHVAAIAAAVAAYGYRVIHIADAGTGHAWAAEGRWRHQTSHLTH